MLENSQADGCGRAGRLFNIYQARQLADTYKTFYIAVAAVSVCLHLRVHLGREPCASCPGPTRSSRLHFPFVNSLRE